MRVELHVRTSTKVRRAKIIKGPETYELELDSVEGLLRARGDFLTDGIQDAHTARIVIESAEGETTHFEDIVRKQNMGHDPYMKLETLVHDFVEPRLAGMDVLELGSRDRRDTRSAWGSIRDRARSYVGLDILPGANVDITGDAHKLSSLFPDRRFDLIYSQFVFEHLAMPWLAAVEINKVLRLGGLAHLVSNQSIGMHDLPWDFFRFSDSAWKALFNASTGFEILGVAMGEPVRLSPLRYHQGFIDHEGGAGYQASAVFVRKLSETQLRWPVEPELVYSQLDRMYPREISD